MKFKLCLLLIFFGLYILGLSAMADSRVYNYKSVKEFKNAADRVQKSNSYTLEVKQRIESMGAVVDLYNKAYMKNGKWRAEISSDGGQTYSSVIIFDGKDCFLCEHGMPYGLKFNPLNNSLSVSKNKGNPVDALFYWDGHGSLLGKDGGKIINNNAKMNGFNCRLIRMNDTAEACISDRLGIAVYYKVKSAEPLMGSTQTTTLNVVKVNTADIPDSVFKLPSGFQVMDFNEQF